MFYSAVFASLAIGSAIAAPLAPVQSQADQCRDYVLISTRGTFEAQGPSMAFVEMIEKTLSKVPGGVEYDVVYPALLDLTQVTPFIGSHDIERYINDGLESCPDQVYALLGYSQGATVTLGALRNIAGTPAEDAIKAVFMVGNPFQVKNQPITFDENGGSTTRGNNGVIRFQIPSINLSQHWVDSGKVQEICYHGDLICNGISLTNFNPNHLLYGSTESVQKMGADFLISKLS